MTQKLKNDPKKVKKSVDVSKSLKRLKRYAYIFFHTYIIPLISKAGIA